jgi:tetratricopeptide (TPR) repeat protein
MKFLVRFRFVPVLLVISLIASLLPQALHCQNLDSLKTLVETSVDEQHKNKIMLQLAEGLLFTNADSARYWANTMLTSDELDDDQELRATLVKAKIAMQQDSLLIAKYILIGIDDILDGVSETYWVLNYHMIRGYVSELNADFSDAVDQNQTGLALALVEKDTAYQCRFYNNLGLIYKAIGNFEDALVNLKKGASLFAAQNSPTYESSAYLNVGATYIDLQKYDSARFYINRAMAFFEDKKSYYELAAAMGNLAELSYLEGNYREAIAYLHKKNVYLDSVNGNAVRATIHLRCNGYEDLAHSYFKIGDLDSAVYYYQLEDSLAATQGLLEYRVSANLGVSQVLEKLNNAHASLSYLRKYIAFKDSLDKKENLLEAEKLKAQYEMKLAIEKDNQQQKEKLMAKEREKGILVFISLLLLVVLIGVYGLYQRAQKTKLFKEAEEMRLKAEKRKLERDLAVKERELTTKQLKLSEAESRIESSLKELKEVILDPQPENYLVLKRLAKQIEGSSDQKSIASLDDYLQESDTRLFEALSRKHPDLTRSELRLCAFIRLNLSSKEIATVMHQNANSLKMARYRLRKKLELGQNQNLVSYLNNLVSDNA